MASGDVHDESRAPPRRSYPVLIEHEPATATSTRAAASAGTRSCAGSRTPGSPSERDAFGADLAGRRVPVRLLLVACASTCWPRCGSPGSYRIGIGVSHVGTSSFAYRYGVFAGDECVATGESVSVHVDGGRPRRCPTRCAPRWRTLRVDGPGRRAAPRRDQARRVREDYPFRLDVRTRFGDLDTNRHVNNVRLAGWYLDGLAELHLDVLGYPTGGPLDGLSPELAEVQYLDEVHYPGIYQLRVGVAGPRRDDRPLRVRPVRRPALHRPGRGGGRAPGTRRQRRGR